MTPPSGKRPNTSNRQRVAKALQRATGWTYQQALQRVEDAATRGLLPPVLDAAGREAAVRMLSSGNTLPPAPGSDSPPPNPGGPDERTGGTIPQGITVIPDGRGSVYMRPLTPEEEAALPKRPYNAGSLTYVQDPMRYRATFESSGHYEPLARPFDNLSDAQRCCEQKLLTQHPDAQMRWEPIDEPNTSWAMEVYTAELGSFAEFGYRVTLLGSDFDYGPNHW